MPKITTHTIADAGVAWVKLKVSKDRSVGGLGCLFRELPTSDVGIDGHIEMVAVQADGTREATGRLISVQIKSGASYFDHADEDAWYVYVPKAVIHYWTRHSLPVLLIIVRPDQDVGFWVRADTGEHEETEASFKIRVPKANTLDPAAHDPLMRVAENVTEADRRLARLEADRPLMQALSAGEAVSVDLGHWVNKSSGRTDVVVGFSRPGEITDGPEGLGPIISFPILGGGGERGVVERLFPWASVTVDRDFLETKMDDLYEEYLAATGTYDSEGARYIDVQGTFDESLFINELEPTPYAEAAGEVEYYRYSLALNEVGYSYLLLNRFLSGE